jgi:hypothetical protein
VHVIERVHGSDLFAGGESCASLHANADQRSFAIVRADEPPRVDDTAAAFASNSKMHVGDRADSH